MIMQSRAMVHVNKTSGILPVQEVMNIFVHQLWIIMDTAANNIINTFSTTFCRRFKDDHYYV